MCAYLLEQDSRWLVQKLKRLCIKWVCGTKPHSALLARIVFSKEKKKSLAVSIAMAESCGILGNV